MERLKINVTVFNAERYEAGWPFDCDAKLVDIIEWFTEKLEEIPEEYREEAECDISSEGGYGNIGQWRRYQALDSPSKRSALTLGSARSSTLKPARRTTRPAGNSAHAGRCKQGV